jgi:hypothetical protein
MGKVKVQPTNSAPPFATPLSKEDIINEIKEARKGPFYTSEEVKEQMKKWKRKRA